MFNAARDDEELARFKDNLTIAQPDNQPPCEHQEEIVGVSSMNEPLLQATLSYEA